MKKLLMKLYYLIMGVHPHNTMFSFNYHNIRSILKFYKQFIRQFTRSDKQIVIDVGGGVSPYYSFFKEISQEYIVVDFKESLPNNEERDIKQIVGMAEKLDFRDEYADIIMSNQVLEHVSDENVSIRETYRVLKKGGVFVGSVPHISPIHLEPYDYRRFTYYGLKKLLEENGFKDIIIESSGGVFKSASVLLLMDWFLKKDDKKGQRFNTAKHFIFAPLTFFINLTSLIADTVFKNKLRSPSNYCWSAVK